MSTFADFQAQSMAPNDFTLYPYSEGWNQDQSYPLPAQYAQHQSYIDSTSFDGYQNQQAYAPLPQHIRSYSNQTIDAKSHLRAPSPYRSPAHSASHSFDYHNQQAPSTISDSGASVQSTLSSAIGSPATQPQSNDWSHNRMHPGIVQQPDSLYAMSTFDFDTIPQQDKPCVDPSLIQPFSPGPYAGAQFPEMPQQSLPYPTAASPGSNRNSTQSPISQPIKLQGSASPMMNQQAWQAYPPYHTSRRPSVSSVHSRNSQNSASSDDSNKGLCPIATCGRQVKDLKAHMLTHQNERPEKCPIPTCEYHTKGFARKYDKNRHTLTHYKGTMVCGFCPGSGSAAEKSFNRADVFKRHLTSVHGVEQTPPNARRKSPTKRPFGSPRETSGMCSTCGNTFANAQEFYEHLDDCVLRVVQQADPSEAINEKLLTEISQDKQVQETMEKHLLPTNIDATAPTSFAEDDEAEDDEDMDEEDVKDTTYGSRRPKPKTRGSSSRITQSGAISKPTKKGLTYSKEGVPLASGVVIAKGNKRRKNYPLSWGAAPEKMRMRKRVLCVYDGQRRLLKDDMMLSNDHEVRIPLPGTERAWVTDLDVQTLRRAEGMHGATEEEKGPWDMEPEELERLMQ